MTQIFRIRAQADQAMSSMYLCLKFIPSKAHPELYYYALPISSSSFMPQSTSEVSCIYLRKWGKFSNYRSSSFPEQRSPQGVAIKSGERAYRIETLHIHEQCRAILKQQELVAFLSLFPRLPLFVKAQEDLPLVPSLFPES